MSGYSREERAALLALASHEELVGLAERCLARGPEPTVLVAPETGGVATQVREPIGHERFLIGDVLACRAEVELDGVRGWAMRLGGEPEDRVAVLAAAICDAAAEAGREQAGEVVALCHRVEARVAAAEAAEWAELAPTVVAFEELT